MIFRRNQAGTKLELRHQRNADCFYDVYSSEYPNGLDDKGKNRVYEIIEKMLPKSRTDQYDNPCKVE